MNLHGVFAVLCVDDHARAVDWYSRLLGRAPDQQPMDWLAQWLSPAGGIQVWRDQERAGRSYATLVVPDMAAERRRLAAAGLTLGPESPGGGGLIAQIDDPDGNRLTLATPPAPDTDDVPGDASRQGR